MSNWLLSTQSRISCFNLTDFCCFSQINNPISKDINLLDLSLYTQLFTTLTVISNGYV